MAAMRSSYGMLGVIYEVTFRVREIAPMAVEHIRYYLDEFADRLDELVAGNRSMMLYLFPFLDPVMVEYRSEDTPLKRANAWQWRLRNFVWSKLGPGFAKIVTSCVPFRGLRYDADSGAEGLRTGDRNLPRPPARTRPGGLVLHAVFQKSVLIRRRVRALYSRFAFHRSVRRNTV